MENRFDYPLDRVLGSYLANFIWLKKIEKIRFAIYCFLYEHSVSADVDILVAIFSPRKSYEVMLKNYAQKNSMTNFKIKRIQKKRRSFKSSVLFIFRIFKHFKFYKNANFIENFILSFLKAYAILSIDYIEKSNIRCQKYISFNSSYLFESFLTYYFRRREIPTYSLQHGIYYQYNNNIPLDVINYENICSDKLLCWGQHTIDQIKFVVPEDVDLILDEYPYIVEEARKGANSDLVLVLLPRIIYIKEIEELLKILSFSRYKFLIRPHPSVLTQVEKFFPSKSKMILDVNSQLSDSLLDCEYKFCIGFNSTSLLEAALYKQKIVQYLSGNDEFILENVVTFKNKEEFLQLNENEIKKDISTKYYFNLD